MMRWWAIAEWWHYAAGLIFASLVGQALILPMMKNLWVGVYGKGRAPSVQRHQEHPMMIGVMERALYYGAWVFGKPEFIGVWLAIKIAGQWSRWAQGEYIAPRKVPGRSFFNVFLVGTGFSIAYGVIGAQITEWLATKQLGLVWSVSSSLIGATCVFTAWAYVVNCRSTQSGLEQKVAELKAGFEQLPADRQEQLRRELEEGEPGKAEE
jgi:hypothetical protein